MLLKDLEAYIGQLLDISSFRDYCPNGLQVEGRREIGRIATGVSASLDFLQAAGDYGADAVLVHHGYFWKNEDARIVGAKRARIALLLNSGMSLLAYHLPLDAHPTLGNNARLGQVLGIVEEGRCGEQNLVALGRLAQPLPLCDFAARVETRLSRRPLVIGADQPVIERIAWCSGGAQDYLATAIERGVDAYLTGEISERTVHLARESGVAFISAGHHATERYGIQALGEHLAERFGIEQRYIEIDNPA